ncbi:MAG: YidC/Oxa1 family membrane protein insertase [Actinomycetota bacterium]|nr:YidC/Oxa1 family membrane protein insertase [Actinomycetota bacterium]
MIVFASPLAPLEDLLRTVLDWLHGTVGLPWAWSIVGLTVIVRMLLVPLTVRQIHSMQAMQRHAPQMKEIQRKYKADKQRRNEELMKFYKENQINPASSCLPLLAQIPIFIALFYVLRSFSDNPPGGQAAVNRGEFGWLDLVPNIAEHADAIGWPGYLLLAIYAGSQVASTLLMSTTLQNKAQRNMMLALPLLFLPFVKNFPTGLVLYWMTTNVWTVGQGLITRRLVPKTPAPPPKRSSRAPRSDETDADGGDGAKAHAPEREPAVAPAPRKVKRKKKARR